MYTYRCVYSKNVFVEQKKGSVSFAASKHLSPGSKTPKNDKEGLKCICVCTCVYTYIYIVYIYISIYIYVYSVYVEIGRVVIRIIIF